MNAIFIAGTGTGVGKTIIADLLREYLKEKGCRVITQKWVQAGSKGKEGLFVPYRFKNSCSPHLAAKIERRKIDTENIKNAFNLLCRKFDFVIVEGTGGVLVPLSNKILLIDIVKEVNVPVLLVAQNKLGVINHTLLTVEALDSRQIPFLGVVFNNARGENKAVLTDNPEIIKRFSKKEVFGVLSWRKKRTGLYKNFLPIGDKVWKKINSKIGLRKI